SASVMAAPVARTRYFYRATPDIFSLGLHEVDRGWAVASTASWPLPSRAPTEFRDRSDSAFDERRPRTMRSKAVTAHILGALTAPQVGCGAVASPHPPVTH